jgi:hypothetical protein
MLNEAGDVSATGKFSLNTASARINMIDVRDVAECAARVLLDDPDSHHGRTYTLTGPRSLTFDEVADRLSLALGRSVTYLPVGDDAKRKVLLGYGVAEWIVDMRSRSTRGRMPPAGATSPPTRSPAFSATPRATSPTWSATMPRHSPQFPGNDRLVQALVGARCWLWNRSYSRSQPSAATCSIMGACTAASTAAAKGRE